MKVGDLVHYSDDYPVGIIFEMTEPTPLLPGYYKVIFTNGARFDDLVQEELEVINESR
tara:strand:+ start:1856 stop:2029 length:174 start_codon:yes stop_codon:yes gene_type:complete